MEEQRLKLISALAWWCLRVPVELGFMHTTDAYSHKCSDIIALLLELTIPVDKAWSTNNRLTRSIGTTVEYKSSSKNGGNDGEQGEDDGHVEQVTLNHKNHYG